MAYNVNYNPSIKLEFERRPCYIYGMIQDAAPVKGFFHMWVTNTNPDRSYDNFNDLIWCGENCDVYALVEIENGNVIYVNPRSIQFADGGGFDEVYFAPLYSGE